MSTVVSHHTHDVLPSIRWSVPKGALRAGADYIERQVARRLGVPIHASWTATPLSARDLTLEERQSHRERPTFTRRSYLLGCRVLKDVLLQIEGHEDTAHLRFPHPHLSLTHSGPLALAIGTEARAVRGLGVDLEQRRTIRPDVDRLFLREAEQRWLATTDPSERAFELLRLWTIKEAVFKADPNNHGRQLYDYVLDDPSSTCGGARLAAGGWKCIYLNTWLPEGVVSVAAFI